MDMLPLEPPHAEGSMGEAGGGSVWIAECAGGKDAGHD